jgi:hypothetical protein
MGSESLHTPPPIIGSNSQHLGVTDMSALVREIGRYPLYFLLFYWICFIFPFPLDFVVLPLQLAPEKDQPEWMKAAGDGLGQAFSWINDRQGDVCTRVGANFLRVQVILQPTGSGDTMRAYVGCLCAAIIAAALALLWMMMKLIGQLWKPSWRGNAFLYGLVRVLVRFFLAEMLFGYGFAKVFPVQFAEPSSYRLNEQLGDMSPMGLLWTFMGFSSTYQIFTGAVEVLSGLLLTTRRTTLLGALLTMAAMGQVFVLNMCFDVPVKLYSFHYLVMALFLAAPDLPRLTKAMVLGMAVAATPFAPLMGRVWLDRTMLALRTLLVALMLWGQVHVGYERWNQTHGGPEPPALGRWNVVSMRIDNKEPSKGDPTTWNWLDFMNKSMLRLSGPTPPTVVYRIAWTTETKNVTLTKFTAPGWSATYAYDFPEPDVLELRGTMDDKAIAATLKRAPERHYQLMTRGFHWIQELPYNR